jgi:hypothetical protein
MRGGQKQRGNECDGGGVAVMDERIQERLARESHPGHVSKYGGFSDLFGTEEQLTQAQNNRILGQLLQLAITASIGPLLDHHDLIYDVPESRVKVWMAGQMKPQDYPHIIELIRRSVENLQTDVAAIKSDRDRMIWQQQQIDSTLSDLLFKYGVSDVYRSPFSNNNPGTNP